MAQTFVEYNGKGIWIRDSLLELPMGYISETIELINNPPTWLKELDIWIKIKAQGEYFGVDISWDEILSDDTKITKFQAIISETIQFLKCKPQFLPVEEINKFRIKEGKAPTWTQPIERESVEKVLEVLLLLFSDLVKNKENDFEDFLI